ncbi:MAG: hypothetical protein JRM77_08380 [Nitrososphaerota archaeon]|nr:hypothetical protein [Nitrososphaerota archaeon]
MTELTHEEAINYVSRHLLEYDDVTMLLYTPSPLFSEELEVEQKRNFVNALRERCQKGKKTNLYAAASGLRHIHDLTRTERDIDLKYWKEFIDIHSKYPGDIKLSVVEDQTLPCISFVLSKFPHGLEGRDSWDLMIEYRIGMKRDQLFKFGAGLQEEGVWEHREIKDKTPEGINGILERLRESKCPPFSEWIEREQISKRPPPPDVAILSAMPREMKYLLQRMLQLKLFKENFHGQIRAGPINHEIVYPPQSYGNKEIGQAVSFVHGQFPSLKIMMLVGIAGGVKESRVGDVVISDEIIGLESEKLLSAKGSEPKLDPSYSVLKLDGGQRLAIRPVRYQISDVMEKRANNLLAKKESNPQWWKKLVAKYLAGVPASPEKKYIETDSPQVSVGKIWSSDHNVDNETLRDAIQEEFKVKAIEMEGAGFAHAARRFSSVDSVDIRGISDSAASRDRKRERELLQPLAAATASACAEAFLELSPSEQRSWPNR